MRAAVLRRHGAAPEYGSHPSPSRGPGQALIQVTAVPVNPLDLLCASGTSYFGEPALPYVPGAQGVGVVQEADIQAARLLGAGRVIAACRDAHGRDRAAALGADAVVNLTDGDGLAARLSEAAGGRLDLVLDPLWGPPAQAAIEALSPGGRLVNLGSSAGAQASAASATLRGRMLSVLGYTNNALSGEQKAEALATILDHAAAGRIDTDREKVPLADVAAAWSRCGQAPHHRAVLIPP